MIRLSAVFWFAFFSAFTSAPEEARADQSSSLVDVGPLQQVRKSLEQVFQFTLDGNALKLDRNRWEAAAKEAPKPPPKPEGFDQDERFGRRAFGRRHVELSSPLDAIFIGIQEQSRANSKGFSMGSGGTSRGSDRSFTGDDLYGKLSSRGDSIRLTLEEQQPPKRTLELIVEDQTSFRIQLTHPDGDLILLHQARNGRFSAVTTIGGRLFAGQGESYQAFLRQHQAEVEATLLPTLRLFGIDPMPAVMSTEVRKAAIDLLKRTPETLAEGRKLLADLDSNSFDVRDKATKKLIERIGVFNDLVEEELKGKSISVEVRARLQSILAERRRGGGDGRTLAAFELMKDPQYAIALFEHVGSDEKPLLGKHLEKLTGQKLGADAAAWKDWAKKKPK